MSGCGFGVLRETGQEKDIGDMVMRWSREGGGEASHSASHLEETPLPVDTHHHPSAPGLVGLPADLLQSLPQLSPSELLTATPKRLP